MARHLTREFLRGALGRGGTVEQFIGAFAHDEGPAIRWIDLQAEDGEIVLSVHEALDEGDEEFLDVYEFTRLADEDDELDGAAARHECDDLEEALALAARLYGASPDRFVNEFVVQDEYADYLRARPARAE